MSSGTRGAFASSVCLLLLSALPALAAKNDWAEGTPGQDNGASRDYYNRAASLPWKHRLGDWRDAKNEEQGNVPYATFDVPSNSTGTFVDCDVTPLVREWLAGNYQNQGFFLRALNSFASFASRETPPAEQRPQLVLADGDKTTTLAPQADTSLNASTSRSMGDSPSLSVSTGGPNSLLRFELPAATNPGALKATLRLYVTRTSKTATIGVFRCAQGEVDSNSPPQWGLAAKYPGDKGIDEDPQVILAATFDSSEWTGQWTQAAPLAALAITGDDAPQKFEPLSGSALSVCIAKGARTGLNTLYKFQKEIGSEPEEVYFRYYLRLGSDWNQTVQGGKLPGVAGTYGDAGWGGRRSNGKNGWSARGKFNLTIPADNPLAGTTPIGTYCYHADMQDFYGTNWIWTKDYLGFLENNRWYCVEQHLKLNKPGANDGVLRAWIDGRLAFEKTDIRFRDLDKLKIEELWMNVYHGGTVDSPYDQHLFIDNVVLAKQYIGPMKR